MKKLFTTLFNHERYETIAVLISFCLLFWLYGCPSTVPSIHNPQQKVTRAELEIELDTILATAEHRFEVLDRQDELKRTILDHSLLAVRSGTVNPLGLITTLASILGIGAVADNVRKRKELKKVLTYEPADAGKDTA